jgi:hypothetical protein
MVGFRSMTMALCLRSMMAAGLRSMMACSELESRTAVSSGAKVEDDGGVLAVDGSILWAGLEDGGSVLAVDDYVLWARVKDDGVLRCWG